MVTGTNASMVALRIPTVNGASANATLVTWKRGASADRCEPYIRPNPKTTRKDNKTQISGGSDCSRAFGKKRGEGVPNIYLCENICLLSLFRVVSHVCEGHVCIEPLSRCARPTRNVRSQTSTWSAGRMFLKKWIHTGIYILPIRDNIFSVRRRS